MCVRNVHLHGAGGHIRPGALRVSAAALLGDWPARGLTPCPKLSAMSHHEAPATCLQRTQTQPPDSTDPDLTTRQPWRHALVLITLAQTFLLPAAFLPRALTLALALEFSSLCFTDEDVLQGATPVTVNGGHGQDWPWARVPDAARRHRPCAPLGRHLSK